MNSLIIRLGQSSIDFAQTTADTNDVSHESYHMNQGISPAANLRDALGAGKIINNSSASLIQIVMIDAPVMLVPVDDFNDNDADALYRHAYPATGTAQNAIVGSSVVPALDVVALFAINKDVNTVVTDHFAQAKFMHAMQPLWTYLNAHHPAIITQGNVLHICFHDGQMNAFSARNNRVRFCNTFQTDRANDAAYLTLNVWTQMGMDAKHDVVAIIGTPPEGDKYAEIIRRYVRHVSVRHLADEFALPASAKEMPVDMQAFIAHGR